MDRAASLRLALLGDSVPAEADGEADTGVPDLDAVECWFPIACLLCLVLSRSLFLSLSFSLALSLSLFLSLASPDSPSLICGCSAREKKSPKDVCHTSIDKWREVL
jgi:hypothetical protein